MAAVFERTGDAVAAALEVQRAFAREAWPDQRELRARLALHTGEARLREAGDWAGPAIIRGQGLRDVAHGGQTLLSNAVREQVGEKVPQGVTFRDLGSRRLRDLGHPERVWQLCHPELRDQFPPLRSLDSFTNNLPVQLTSFVGRDEDLAELRSVLSESRVVTLTGAGGCGKTRLGLHAAADVIERYPDGVWWIDLGPVSDPHIVPHVVARAFGVREEESRPVLETLCERLAGLDALIALDNCEQLAGAAAELVHRLVRAVPTIRVMVTSRQPLGIPGEVRWMVPSLDDEGATRLFIDRGAEVRPGFSPDEVETEVVSEICQRLDGIPLAIELAAARIRMMPPAQIAAGLADRFRLLTGDVRRELPRQRTLETSVAWSYDLLDERERALLRRLAVFSGGFSLGSAEGVCAADPLSEYAILDLVSGLVDKSLVQFDHTDAEGRYRLPETIRLYAYRRLAESNETDLTRDRHLGFYLALAERAEPEVVLADGPRWLARLEREHDNLRAAMEWADASGAHEQFLRLATALTLFWELHGHMQAGGRWFARALARDDGPSPTRARALWGAAHLALYGGDIETLARRAPEALKMAEEVGDDWAMSRILNTNGFVQAWVYPEPEAARKALARSIELAEQHGDNWAVGDGWKMMTVACLVQDDYDGLAAANRELLRVGERLGNQFFVGMYYIALGAAAFRQGDLDAARQALETAAAYDEQLGGAATGGFALAFLAETEALTGQYDVAHERLNGFLARGAATGAPDRALYPDSFGVPFAVAALARLLIGRGAPADAVALVEPLIAKLRPVGMPLLVSSSLSLLGLAHLALGDADAAKVALEEASRVGRSINNPWLTSQAVHGLALVARSGGDLSGAEDLHQEALTLRSRRGLLPGVAESLEALGSLAADHESGAEAARLFGAASVLRRSMGLARWPAEQAGYDAAVGQARQAIDETTFDEAWAAGETLTVGEAVAYASRARGERKRPSTGWASLTPTELEVVRLAAQGLTNPQIAERLFVARGTVKNHLASVYVKLGVTSRAQLAAEATRRGTS